MPEFLAIAGTSHVHQARQASMSPCSNETRMMDSLGDCQIL